MDRANRPLSPSDLAPYYVAVDVLAAGSLLPASSIHPGSVPSSLDRVLD